MSNRILIVAAGGVIGFIVAGLSAAYAKMLINDQDLLVVAVAGGVSVTVALVAVDILSEWAARRTPS